MKKGEWKIGLFLLPGILGTLLFFALPLCYCLLFSLSASFGSFRFNGGANYLSLFRSEAFLLALKNTFALLFVYLLTVILLALGVTFLLDRLPKYNWALMACSVAMFLPSALIVSCAKTFPFLCEEMPALLFFLIFLWRHIGINSLILHTAAGGMDPALMESAALDGAGKVSAFLRVEFFYLLPHIKFLFVFDVICFFRMFRESYLLYGLYPPSGVYMMQNFFFNNFQNLNYQRLSTGASITVLLLLIINWALLRLGERHEFV